MVMMMSKTNWYCKSTDLFLNPNTGFTCSLKIMMQNIQEDFAVGRLYPDLEKMKEVSIKISTKVAEEAYK